MKDFYLLTLLFLLPGMLIYLLFRISMYQYLKRTYHCSTTKFKKSTKGKKNYWFYEQLHQEYGFPFLYCINQLFLFLYPCTVLLHLLLGWIKIMSIPSCILLIFTYLLLGVMYTFSDIQHLIEEFGTWLVLCRKNKRHGIDSILFLLIILLGMCGLIYREIVMCVQVWS